MPDKDFLAWIHERLEFVHNEDPLMDYMHKLRAIIRSIPEDQDTPNVCSGNSLEDVMGSKKSKGVWKTERSSGYRGFRCQRCGVWVYEYKPKSCRCDESPYVN